MFTGIFIALTLLTADLGKVRTLYKEAISSSSKADELYKLTQPAAAQNAVYRAYFGTALALQAKHGWSPASKLSKASMAMDELNKAVIAAPNDLEVRFLRFSFESNLPAIVSGTRHLAEDKKMILGKMYKAHGLWPVMKSFLLNSAQLTAAEKKLVQAV
ncbi:MAG: hypothetical protein JNL57_05110 [Bacteroidetes bacterium]|nr:hypothetical protein [Bacteroidota bacterium]